MSTTGKLEATQDTYLLTDAEGRH